MGSLLPNWDRPVPHVPPAAFIDHPDEDEEDLAQKKGYFARLELQKSMRRRSEAGDDASPRTPGGRSLGRSLTVTEGEVPSLSRLSLGAAPSPRGSGGGGLARSMTLDPNLARRSANIGRSPGHEAVAPHHKEYDFGSPSLGVRALAGRSLDRHSLPTVAHEGARMLSQQGSMPITIGKPGAALPLRPGGLTVGSMPSSLDAYRISPKDGSGSHGSQQRGGNGGRWWTKLSSSALNEMNETDVALADQELAHGKAVSSPFMPQYGLTGQALHFRTADAPGAATGGGGGGEQEAPRPIPAH